MKEKIFLTRTLHDFALKELKKKFQVEIHTGKIPIPKNSLKSKIKQVDGLICFPYDQINKEVIQVAKNLKVISTFSVGYDHIDTKFAKEKKIRVGYTPEVLTNATADMAFALMIDSLRRISEGDRIIRKQKWKQIYGAYDYVGLDLQGKTLGIIGLGRIGKILAKRAKAFDMKIIYHNRKQILKTKEKELEVKYTTFNKLITKSDIISIHVPHTNETNQMFNMKIFKKKKDNAQPTQVKTGGSTFKNPIKQTNKKVWELIKSSVPKNTTFGGAMISDKHSNFFVNKNKATFDDMKKLIDFVKKNVKEKTGINLDLEIEIVG